MSVRYSLKVTANVEVTDNSLSEERPDVHEIGEIPDSVQKEVLDELKDIGHWTQYIIESMNMCTDEEEGMDVHSFCLTVTQTTPASFDCILEWTSDKIEEDTLQTLHDALDWFIDDRMCFYEFTGSNWHCYTNWDDLEITDA